MVMSWGITATGAMLLVNIPISVGLWYGGDAARMFFRQVCLNHCSSAVATKLQLRTLMSPGLQGRGYDVHVSGPPMSSHTQGMHERQRMANQAQGVASFMSTGHAIWS